MWGALGPSLNFAWTTLELQGLHQSRTGEILLYTRSTLEFSVDNLGLTLELHLLNHSCTAPEMRLNYKGFTWTPLDLHLRHT
eukprot:1429383-Pyramimonas_sp.AAC.1